MLEPQDRRHLMEALRPPAGYTLDRAIGTTFTLDLLTLLTVPLSFTMFGWEEEDGAPAADPLTLFEGLRRFSERIAVFCQAGQISVPSSSPLLLGYLENSVVEVAPRTRGHIFHPKVWVLRLVSEDGPTRYRLLVASRNLTFDRSWDTLLVLEGTVSGARPANPANRPLERFIESLPELALRSVSPQVREAVDLMRSELPQVAFATPPGFTGLRFWPLGLSREKEWPFDGEVDRMLCVSPFATNGLLKRLPGRKGGVLVSRTEELDRLKAETIESFEEAYVLHQGAETEDIPEAETPETGPTEDDLLASGEGEVLRGLHAKLYVADSGKQGRIWTGSANATAAAFSGNVEFLVELFGERSLCGIDRILERPQNSAGFADLLQLYTPPREPPETDEVREKLEQTADMVRRTIVGASLRAVVAELPGEPRRYSVVLEASEPVDVGTDVKVVCWPVTLGAERAEVVEGTGPVMAVFESSLEAITSFFAFEVAASEGQTTFSRRFAVNAEVVGAPADRRDAVIASLLSDPGRIMRLILMLLAEGSGNEREIAIALGGGARQPKSGNGKAPSGVEIPLFEELVRALWNNPRALDRIDGMLAAVRREGGDHLIPEELGEIWPQIMKARNKIEGGRT